MKSSLITEKGSPYPLGATLQNGGTNFSVFSPHATHIELLLFENEDDVQPQIIPLDPTENKSYHYWHIFVPKIEKNQMYGYRVFGDYIPEEGMLFDPSKVLVDPYAKAIVGKYDRKLANAYGKDNLHSCLKSAVISNEFDWENETSPTHSMSKSVVYEMHLAGFTRHPSSGLDEKIRGTYLGLIQKIPYLKSLGITAVELLPVYAFDPQDAPGDNLNYWGYSPINFFAVHAPYAAAQTPQEIVNEFKTMVKALHKANIEVILDVVYNHTTENDAHRDGPTLSMRGFANRSYYLMQGGNFLNYTGTGNTINAYHSVVRRMIRASLKYWVKEMHIDGFRFDLASVLSRNEEGVPVLNPPILWTIDSDPELSQTKIIAEPWDASGLHQASDFAGDRWMIWNDNYRDSVRRFVKGDSGQVSDLIRKIMGSPYELRARHTSFEPCQNLHFITCHDGFTLYDLVSYNEKHNGENGEDNRDGHSPNYSWNCGVEGETDNPEILQLRYKQIRNFISILFLSHGTPMLNMGDEIARSQNGNNNAYCQDNELTWFDWGKTEQQDDMLRFTRNLIRLKKNVKTFTHSNFYTFNPKSNQPFVKLHGVALGEPDRSSASRSFAIEIKAPMYNEHFYMILNMYWEPLSFELPPSFRWKKVFDTETGFENEFFENKIDVAERTLVFLTAK